MPRRAGESCRVRLDHVPGGGIVAPAVRDVIDMWQNTRMVVLTAMTSALYAAILIPFKVLPIIPGVTEFRPANAVPVICSFLFGPAAAWGSAIGNVIGDFFGGIGPGDFFGFLGNFLYGYIPYKAWELISERDPVPDWHGRWSSFIFDREWLKFAAVVFLSAGACALVVGWGLNALGFIPFAVLGNIVLFNNVVVGGTVGPLLLAVIYPRVKRGRLLYRDVMPQRAPRRPLRSVLGLLFIAAAVVGGMVVGNLLSTGQWHPLDLAGVDAGRARMMETSIGLLPALLLLAIGVLLL